MANRLDARAVAMDIFRNTVWQAALLKDSRVMVSKSLPLLPKQRRSSGDRRLSRCI